MTAPGSHRQASNTDRELDLELELELELDGDGDAGRRASPRNLVALAAIVVVSLVGIVFVARSAPDPRADPSGSTTSDQQAAPLDQVRAEPHVTFRSTELGAHYGEVALAPIGTDGSPSPAGRASAGISCDRIAEGGDRAICLVADRGAITSYRAVILDDQYHELFTVDLPGEPSRARVSSDGRYGALTAFVTGHSYASIGFSTFTEILDLRTGESFGDLEQFSLWRDGAVVDAADRNFWGVTFGSDPRTFYATAATGGVTYLVRGDLDARTLTTVRAGVECPMLSPDGTRIAFKERTGDTLGPAAWRLAVLDLATGSVTDTAETRSVDDQPEWLDDQHILYGLPQQAEASSATDVWVVPADGTGSPEVFLQDAWSPTYPKP